MCALSSIFSVTQRDAIGGFSLSRLVQGREPELRHLASGAGPARLDASPADPGRRDAHVHVAGAACPWLQVRSILKALYVTLIGDCVRVTLHQDAPGCTARLVEVVSFEADRPVGVHGQQRVWCGAEDNGLSRYREVDRQHHDSVRGGEPDAPGEPHDIQISGTASDLALFLWQRKVADRLEVQGDTSLLSGYFVLVPPL